MKPTETLGGKETHTINIAPTHPRQNYTNHLSPFGTPLPPMTNSNTLQICFQNTQHSFQIHGETIELPNFILNLQSLVLACSSPLAPTLTGWYQLTGLALAKFSNHISTKSTCPQHLATLAMTLTSLIDIWSEGQVS
jgi:hypothetical protein